MRLFSWLVLLAIVSACSKESSSESPWSASEIQVILDECNGSTSLKASLKKPATTQGPICQCYADAVKANFTPDNFYDEDTELQKKNNDLLIGCAKKSGESIAFSILSKMRLFRFPDQEKRKSLLSRSLEKVKPAEEAPAIGATTGAEAGKTTIPLPTPAEAPKRPQWTPEEEQRKSTSTINENNRLVFHAPWIIKTKNDACQKAGNVNCCLVLKPGTKFPLSFGEGDSIVFSGEGYDPLPADPRSAFGGGIHSEYDFINPNRANDPNKSISIVSHPPMVHSVRCERWDDVERRKYNVAIAKFREAFGPVATYEKDGEYSSAPINKHAGAPMETTTEPTPFFPTVTPPPAAHIPPADTSTSTRNVDPSKPAKPELPLYGLKDYSVYRFELKDGSIADMYTDGKKYLIVKKNDSGFSVLGSYANLKIVRGGFGVKDPFEDDWSTKGLWLRTFNNKDVQFEATLDNGKTMARQFPEMLEYNQELAAQTNLLVKDLTAKMETRDKLKAQGFTRAHDTRWTNLYTKANNYYYLDGAGKPVLLYKTADENWGYGAANNVVESVNEQMKAFLKAK